MIRITVHVFVAVILLTSCAYSLAAGQTKPGDRRELKTFSQQTLGLKFDYDPMSDVIESRFPSKSTMVWRDTTLIGGKIRLKLPEGFHIILLHFHNDWLPHCEGSSFGDSSFLITNLDTSGGKKPRGVGLYITSATIRYIADNEGFVPWDSTYGAIQIKDNDTLSLNWALQHHSWASEGTQGMTFEATYLQTSNWEGLRGSNFLRIYDEGGNAGEQQITRAFLIQKLNQTCNLVSSYFDAQLEANPFGEVDFYELVSTIDIIP